MNKLWIEKRQHLYVLTMGLNRAAKHREWVNSELTKALKNIRSIQKYYRSGQAEEQNSWDCGRQDAFGEMVDHALQEYESLKIAYKLQRQDATKAVQALHRAVGLDD